LLQFCRNITIIKHFYHNCCRKITVKLFYYSLCVSLLAILHQRIHFVDKLLTTFLSKFSAKCRQNIIWEVMCYLPTLQIRYLYLTLSNALVEITSNSIIIRILIIITYICILVIKYILFVVQKHFSQCTKIINCYSECISVWNKIRLSWNIWKVRITILLTIFLIDKLILLNFSINYYQLQICD